MKTMFTMGFRNSFFDQPAMGAFPDFSLPPPGPAPAPSPSPSPAPAPAPSPEFFPTSWPYYYPPAQPVYQVQAPPQAQPPAPVTTVVKTEGIPPAVYYVGGAALLLGLVALVASRS